MLTRRFLGFYEGHTTDLTRPYPGVLEALERLHSAGVRMGICTNKPERPTGELLRDLRLAPYFQAVFGGDTVESVKKPDPRLTMPFSMRSAPGPRKPWWSAMLRTTSVLPGLPGFR